MSSAANQPAGDAAARVRIGASLDESLLVEASAGTGKTSELVRRIVGALSSGRVRVERIAAVTFTNKAAGELKIRIRQALDEARRLAGDESVLRPLEQALARLEEASIGTIHAFCAQLLRERPVEARVDPLFEQLTEQEAHRLFDRAFSGWFESVLSSDPPVMRRVLARLAWEGNRELSATRQLKEAGWKLVEWRDYNCTWEEREYALEENVDRLVDAAATLDRAASLCPRPNDKLVASLRPVQQFITWVRRAESVSARDYAVLEALLVKLGRDLPDPKKDKGSGFFAEGLPRESVLEGRNQFRAALRNFRQETGASLACGLRREMLPLIDGYEDLKSRSGKLDFVDLLLRARNLLRDNPDVRAYFQQRFDAVFVDEFQDTDPLQAEVLLLLCASDPRETDWLRATPVPGKLFLVGDPKQSIYKFRRADVVLYRSLMSHLSGCGVGETRLTRNFRSVKPLQQLVNAAFAPLMTGGAENPDYSPLEENGPEIPGQPAVVVVPAPRPYGSTRISYTAIDDCLPEAMASFLAWVLRESGWSVRDRDHDGRLVPVQPGHICILFRRFVHWGSDVTGGYVRALETRGIPHLLAGSKTFHERAEVEMLRAALTAIEWPDNELAVFATLKGPLFAVDDSLLLAFRHKAGRLHPFLPDLQGFAPEYAPVTSALQTLAGLHRSRNHRAVADTINVLLETARAHAGLLLRHSGQQVLANVHRVCDLARSFEMTGGFSFRGFVDELSRQAEKSGGSDAPVLEEASEGVRLMTVHAAKGLEFPIVILADMTARLAPREASLFTDGGRKLAVMPLLDWRPWELIDHDEEELRRERAEGIRVAYVATTRARDLLVVPAVGDQMCEGWLEPLNRTIFPRPGLWRRPLPQAEGCPIFTGQVTVLERSYRQESEEEGSVKPGCHLPQAGDHQVVWWDPALLESGGRLTPGVRRAELLVEGPEAQSGRGQAEYNDWWLQRQRSIERGSIPEFQIVTPSTVPASALDVSAEVPVRIEYVPRPLVRPSGPRFGSLIHAVLHDVRVDWSAGEIQQAAELHGRIAGASAEEISACADAVANALRHPILERARHAAEIHREVPVVCRIDAERVLEGFIDLAFREDSRWVIVDFKSDAEIAGNEMEYRRQVQLYARALTQITRLPAEAVLLSL